MEGTPGTLRTPPLQTSPKTGHFEKPPHKKHGRMRTSNRAGRTPIRGEALACSELGVEGAARGPEPGLGPFFFGFGAWVSEDTVLLSSLRIHFTFYQWLKVKQTKNLHSIAGPNSNHVVKK